MPKIDFLSMRYPTDQDLPSVEGSRVASRARTGDSATIGHYPARGGGQDRTQLIDDIAIAFADGGLADT